MRGLRLLQKHGVEHNILVAVNRTNADHPLEVYRFLRDDAGTDWMQFIPVVERVDEHGLGLGGAEIEQSVPHRTTLSVTLQQIAGVGFGGQVEKLCHRRVARR